MSVFELEKIYETYEQLGEIRETLCELEVKVEQGKAYIEIVERYVKLADLIADYLVEYGVDDEEI